MALNFSRNASGFLLSRSFASNLIRAPPVFNTAPGCLRHATNSQIKNACIATPMTMNTLESVPNEKNTQPPADVNSEIRNAATPSTKIAAV